MSALFDQVAWWVGAAVIGSAGLLGAAAVIAGVTWVAVVVGQHQVRRLGNIAENLEALWAWRDAGRPRGAGEMTASNRMVPSAGEYEEPRS